MSHSQLHDVLIAGGGPVGLFLACELALAGVDVVVLEQAAHPQSPLKLPPLGARGLSVASAEALYRRGLLDGVLAAASSTGSGLPRSAAASAAASPRRAQVGHFAGIPIDPDLVDLSGWTHRPANPASTNFAIDMWALETVLTARALALGVEIRRGVAVTDCSDDGELVTIRAGDQAWRARWLVGCDGGRSAVRRLAGFGFPGTEPEFTAYHAQVQLADPEKLRPGRNTTPTGFYMNRPGLVSIADFDGGAFDRSAPITREHFQGVLRRVSGTDVTVSSMALATSFTDRARLATSYRRGRVLLAGDAAHIHSALGGQGLNAGLGDAMNLGWKLAATVKGTAAAGLLDTYHAERHPIGQWAMDWTRAQSALMKPTPQCSALERIVRDLAGTRDGATYFAEQLWGISLRYDLGGTHPLVGRSAPDLPFDDGSRLADHLHRGSGLLVDLTGHPALQVAAMPWAARLVSRSTAAGPATRLSALLVRPDGFVAWAAEGPPELGEFQRAAARWFGEPRTVPTA